MAFPRRSQVQRDGHCMTTRRTSKACLPDEARLSLLRKFDALHTGRAADDHWVVNWGSGSVVRAGGFRPFLIITPPIAGRLASCYTPNSIYFLQAARIEMPFPSSPWTRIAQLSENPKDESILQEFYALYSGPVYALVSWKYPDLDSRELTQEIFSYIFSKDLLEKANRERGKLRTYLVQIIKGVASKAWRTQTRRTRIELPALDVDACEAFAASISEGKNDPGTSLDVLLARQTFRRSIERLRQRYTEQGRAEAFEILIQRCLDEETQDGATKLGISAEAMRVQLHRFRKRLRQAFDEEVRCAVIDPESVADERDYLLRLLNQHGTH